MMKEPGRSMWTGSVVFGLVVVPVKLYTAVTTHDISFRQVHRTDGGRITQKRVCSVDGSEVPYAEIAKGYEDPATGMITVLTADDLAGLPLPTAKTIEVTQFSDPADVDPLTLDRSYYVLPGTAGGGPYALLAEALHRTGLAGVCKVALRQRETMALLTETDGVLILRLLLWPDEVKDVQAPAAPDLSPALIGQALSLLEAMTGKYDPATHTDRYAEALAAVVAAKTAGNTLPASAPGTEATAATDLTDMLAASVTAAKAARAKAEEATP